MCLIARRVGNTLIDPSALVLNHGITGDAVEPFGEAEKCLHACRAIRDIKFSNQVVEQTLDVPSCIVAYPRVIDTVEQRLLRRLAREVDEALDAMPASGDGSESLAFVHRAAACGNLSIERTADRIEASRFHLNGRKALPRIPNPPEIVENDAGGTPR